MVLPNNQNSGKLISCTLPLLKPFIVEGHWLQNFIKIQSNPVVEECVLVAFLKPDVCVSFAPLGPMRSCQSAIALTF